jgi:hypothetical protein
LADFCTVMGNHRQTADRITAQIVSIQKEKEEEKKR